MICLGFLGALGQGAGAAATTGAASAASSVGAAMKAARTAAGGAKTGSAIEAGAKQAAGTGAAKTTDTLVGKGKSAAATGAGTPTGGAIAARGNPLTNNIFTSLNKPALDPKTNEPLTGIKGLLTKGLRMYGDLQDFKRMNPFQRTVAGADMATGGQTTKFVQENILGALNNGTPIRSMGGLPFMAKDLFTQQGVALLMDRIQAKRQGNKEMQRRKQEAGRKHLREFLRQ